MKECLTAAGYESGHELVRNVESRIVEIDSRPDLSRAKKDRVIRSYRSFLEKVSADLTAYELSHSSVNERLLVAS